MKTKRPGKRKPCKFSDMGAEGSFELDPSVYDKSNPYVANHQTPNLYDDTNITSSEPSFQQLLLCGAEDIIDLTNLDENVPAPPPVGSLMKSGKNGSSSSFFQPQKPPEGVYVQLSSSHLQPSHPLIKDVIDKYSCSQTLLESVLRCTQSGPKLRGSKINAIDKHDGLEIVISQNSQPQAGADKEAHSRSTLPVESTIGTSKRGSKRSTLHVESTASELGNNRRKSTRRNNLGPGPSNLEGPSRTGTEAMASAEVRELREKVVAMEHTNAQREDEMKLLRPFLLDLQKKLADKDGVPPEASQAGDVPADSGVLPSTSAQSVLSDKNLNHSKTHSKNTTKGLPKKS